MKFNISHKFVSESFWSLSGNVISLAAGLAAVKIITRLVQADDYGTASLVLGVVALLNSLLIGPLMSAHTRVYFDYLEQGKGLWFARAFNWILSIAGFVSLLIYASIAYLYDFGNKHILLMLFVPALFLILAKPYLSARTSYLEAHRRQKQLAIVNIAQKVLYPGILFVFLSADMMPENAIILSQALAVILLLIFLRAPVEQKASDQKPVDKSLELAGLRKSFTSFGWSLPLGYLLMWIFTTSDRYLIEHYMDLRIVGIYTMNYGFWSVPYLMLNSWLENLTRPYLYSKAAKSDWLAVKDILLRRLLFAVIASALGTVFLYFLAEPIASMMLGPGYWVGRQLMAYIAVAHCCMVIGYSVLPLFLACKKAKVILFATSAAALSNIGLNVIVIPAHGMIGAAVSTLISYLIWLCVLAGGAHMFFQSVSEQPGFSRLKAAT